MLSATSSEIIRYFLVVFFFCELLNRKAITRLDQEGNGAKGESHREEQRNEVISGECTVAAMSVAV